MPVACLRERMRGGEGWRLYRNHQIVSEGSANFLERLGHAVGMDVARRVANDLLEGNSVFK